MERRQRPPWVSAASIGPPLSFKSPRGKPRRENAWLGLRRLPSGSWHQSVAHQWTTVNGQQWLIKFYSSIFQDGSGCHHVPESSHTRRHRRWADGRRCHGQCGASVSESMPHFARVVDDVTIIRSVHTTQFNHAPAHVFMNTGHQIVGRPSAGAWCTHGLGSEAENLPGFVVMTSGHSAPDGGKSLWSSGYLPTTCQGVELRTKGEPVLFLSNPADVDHDSRRSTLDALAALNRQHFQDVGDPEIETRIAAMELAFKMQSSVPDHADLSSETKGTLDSYGVADLAERSFAKNCLMARRLVERGVRFVQLYHRRWDHHGSGAGDDLLSGLPARCRETDKAAAALITDLKQRGLRRLVADV